MENKLQIFNNPAFGNVRTIEEDGTVLFCAKDVAKCLEYADTINAIKRHCRGVVKRHLPTESGIQQMNFIAEPDLYRLIFGSKLEKAQEFEQWVVGEVLPSIRKTGGYVQADNFSLGKLAEMVDHLAAVAEQMGLVTVHLAQIVNNLTNTQAQPVTEASAQADGENIFVTDGSCKLERAPQPLRAQVDAMFRQMITEQNMNFSAIARFCLLKGYYVSNPSVRRYYDRNFMA